MKKMRYNYAYYNKELLAELRPNTEAIARKFTSPYTSPEDLRILADALEKTAKAISQVAESHERNFG